MQPRARPAGTGSPAGGRAGTRSRPATSTGGACFEGRTRTTTSRLAPVVRLRHGEGQPGEQPVVGVPDQRRRAARRPGRGPPRVRPPRSPPRGPAAAAPISGAAARLAVADLGRPGRRNSSDLVDVAERPLAQEGPPSREPQQHDLARRRLEAVEHRVGVADLHQDPRGPLDVGARADGVARRGPGRGAARSTAARPRGAGPARASPSIRSQRNALAVVAQPQDLADELGRLRPRPARRRRGSSRPGVAVEGSRRNGSSCGPAGRPSTSRDLRRAIALRTPSRFSSARADRDERFEGRTQTAPPPRRRRRPPCRRPRAGRPPR